MSGYLKQLLFLVGLTVLSFVVYLALFWVGAATFLTILFYRGILLAVIACLITAVAAVWVGQRIGDTSLPVAAAALSFSVNVCFLVLLPVTIDRSVTVYLLSTIERQQDAGIGSAALQERFINGYVVKMSAIDRRIDEQRKSGNVEVSADGKVRLTAQGERFMAFSRSIAKLFGTDRRFVGARSPGGAKSN